MTPERRTEVLALKERLYQRGLREYFEADGTIEHGDRLWLTRNAEMCMRSARFLSIWAGDDDQGEPADADLIEEAEQKLAERRGGRRKLQGVVRRRGGGETKVVEGEEPVAD